MKLIGTTETHDPCFIPNWDENLLDTNIIISKRLTDDMIDKLVRNKNRVVFHHTITGYGGSVIEPGVKEPIYEFSNFLKLLESGFPINHYVLRVDPIIPFDDLLVASMGVLDMYSEWTRSNDYRLNVRISLLDSYNHVKDRFKDAGINIPYSGFHAPKECFNLVATIIKERFLSNIKFSACAESGFKEFSWISKAGCASESEVMLCDPIHFGEYVSPKNPQRPTCNCLSKKQILGVKPSRCPHGCLYCYWKS